MLCTQNNRRKNQLTPYNRRKNLLTSIMEQSGNIFQSRQGDNATRNYGKKIFAEGESIVNIVYRFS